MSASEFARKTMEYTKRPTDERGLLPLDVARSLLAKAKAYPGAPVHEGRTPDEVKTVAISHDLHAALVSLETPEELVKNLLRLKINYPVLYDARPLVERFGDAILPWLAGQVENGVLRSKTWEVAPALAMIGSDAAFELLLKVSVIGFGNDKVTKLAEVSSLPELDKKAKIDIRVLEAITEFAKKNPKVAARVLVSRSDAPHTKAIMKRLGLAPADPPAKPKAKPAAPVAPKSKGPTMASIWARLEKYAKQHKLPFPLQKPAKASAIAAAEKTMGLTFPADFRESLLVHDGQPSSDGEPKFPWMPGCDHLASLKAIVAQWKDEQDRVQDAEKVALAEGDRFRTFLWHSQRIPIAGSAYWDQDNTYLDLVPGPKGTVGQLVTMTSECDFAVLGTSLRDAMDRWATLLESGAWTPEGPKGKKVSGHRADAFAKTTKKR